MQAHFQDRGSFVELGYFDKHFVKNTIQDKKRLGREKPWEFFLLDTLKATFWVEDLTQVIRSYYILVEATFF